MEDSMRNIVINLQSKMYIYFSFSSSDQIIAHKIVQRLSRILDDVEILSESAIIAGGNVLEENTNFILKSEFFVLLTSLNHSKPTQLIDKFHLSHSNANESKICIHINECRFSDVWDDNSFVHLPKRQDEAVPVNSSSWEDEEIALDNTAMQIAELVKARKEELILKQAAAIFIKDKIKEYLSFFDLDGAELVEEEDGTISYCHENQKVVTFIPISLLDQGVLEDKLLHYAESKENKVKYFFFPTDWFLTIKNKKDNVSNNFSSSRKLFKEISTWISVKNLGNKLHIVDTFLLINNSA